MSTSNYANYANYYTPSNNGIYTVNFPATSTSSSGFYTDGVYTASNTIPIVLESPAIITEGTFISMSLESIQVELRDHLRSLQMIDDSNDRIDDAIFFLKEALEALEKI